MNHEVAQWDQMTFEQRLIIFNHANGAQRIGPRVKHKILYGRWDALAPKMQDRLYRIDWIAALLFPVTSKTPEGWAR